jgi:hypothetical protein
MNLNWYAAETLMRQKKDEIERSAREFGNGPKPHKSNQEDSFGGGKSRWQHQRLAALQAAVDFIQFNLRSDFS